ncbi:hypothetical protein HDE_01770 [Halotydeus destructor]|nr:hypothetical protein HDE_01770 [Halotydeus destructor]
MNFPLAAIITLVTLALLVPGPSLAATLGRELTTVMTMASNESSPSTELAPNSTVKLDENSESSLVETTTQETGTMFTEATTMDLNGTESTTLDSDTTTGETTAQSLGTISDATTSSSETTTAMDFSAISTTSNMTMGETTSDSAGPVDTATNSNMTIEETINFNMTMDNVTVSNMTMVMNGTASILNGTASGGPGMLVIVAMDTRGRLWGSNFRQGHKKDCWRNRKAEDVDAAGENDFESLVSTTLDSLNATAQGTPAIDFRPEQAN